MNKELIKKYKNEFDHWVNDGEILMHYGNKWLPVTLDAKWEFFISDLEKMGCFGYIINDEYVEFRKALAEGKSIQAKGKTGGYYIDILLPVLFNLPVEKYRIKPEEHKFKVGDWVTEQGVILQIPEPINEECLNNHLALYGRRCKNGNLK